MSAAPKLGENRGNAGKGRPKGVPNRASAAKAAGIAASGLTPLDYMLSVLRDPEASKAERTDAAKAAAPYIHPRLAPVDKDGGPQTINVRVVA